MRTLRLILALALTAPLYAVTAYMPGHPFPAEYEGFARELIGR